jgi:hypothetical protein
MQTHTDTTRKKKKRKKKKKSTNYLERLLRDRDKDLDRLPLPGEPELRGETDLR